MLVTICDTAPGNDSMWMSGAQSISTATGLPLSLGCSDSSTSSRYLRRLKERISSDDWSTATCLKLRTRAAARWVLVVMMRSDWSMMSKKLCRPSSSRVPAARSSRVSFSSCTRWLVAVTQMPSGVLISCATPATSRPSEASFSCRTSSDWASCKAVRAEFKAAFCSSSASLALRMARSACMRAMATATWLAMKARMSRSAWV